MSDQRREFIGDAIAEAIIRIHLAGLSETDYRNGCQFFRKRRTQAVLARAAGLEPRSVAKPVYAVRTETERDREAAAYELELFKRFETGGFDAAFQWATSLIDSIWNRGALPKFRFAKPR